MPMAPDSVSLSISSLGPGWIPLPSLPPLSPQPPWAMWTGQPQDRRGQAKPCLTPHASLPPPHSPPPRKTEQRTLLQASHEAFFHPRTNLVIPYRVQGE